MHTRQEEESEHFEEHGFLEDIEHLKAENEQTKKLLHDCMAENAALKAKIRELESGARGASSSRSFCSEVADALCEELVLLDEDISFISTIVKPAEIDPYTSTLGRVQPVRASNLKNGSRDKDGSIDTVTDSDTDEQGTRRRQSVSEQLQARSHPNPHPASAPLRPLDEEEEGDA